MNNSIENITQHILAYADGEKMELAVIVDALYAQLCKIADIQLNKLNPNLITPNDLVHEVYLKFSKSLAVNAKGRMHFLAIAATAMRQLILDQLKGNKREKRGGHLSSTTLTDSKVNVTDNSLEILAVNGALSKLEEIEPILASTVECRYFAGYSEIETAEALDVSGRTVRRYWKRARRWLAMELSTES